MKYGVTLRTMQYGMHHHNRTALSVHNVVISKDQTLLEAAIALKRLAAHLAVAFSRSANLVNSSGGTIRSYEWSVQNGEPGDDLTLFIDEYEE